MPSLRAPGTPLAPLAAVLGVVALSLTLLAPTAVADSQDRRRVERAERGFLGVPLPTSPAGDPPGANDWDCKPSKRRPTPVILVHGTFGDRKNLLERLSGRVKRAGYCVYSLDYGNRGTGGIVKSARQLKEFTNRVLASTGAEKVSMVGHSQGGMMPRYYIKFLGGKKVIDDLVGLAPSHHGTSIVFGGENPVSDLLVGGICKACLQQAAGSRFLKRLNAGDETPGRVSYTNITTRYDQVVVPHTSGYLRGSKRTTNLTIQRKCGQDIAEHVFIPQSLTAIQITMHALNRKGPAKRNFQPKC